MKLPIFRRRDEQRTRGQALVEFAIILPVLALLMVMSLDFGRVFFGWVGLQNVSRVAANFAAVHPDAFDPAIPNNVQKQALLVQFGQQVAREAAGLNCSPLPVVSPSPTYIPVPSFTDSNGNGRYDVGEEVSVDMWCSFGLLTPLANSFFGGGVDITASSVFAVRGGTIAGQPISTAAPTPSATASSSSSASASAAASICPLPIANFVANPTTGKRTLNVQFTDTSQTFGCTVSGWTWNFGDGSTSTVQNPTHAYTRNGTYTVTLTVTSQGGLNSYFQPGYITVCGNC